MLLAAWIAREARGRYKAGELTRSLAVADIHRAQEIVDQTPPYRRWVLPRLRDRFRTATDPDERLRISVGLSAAGGRAAQVNYPEQLLGADPDELMVLREQLTPSYRPVATELWRVLEDGDAEPAQRFRAACTLAGWVDQQDARWEPHLDLVADQLLDALHKSPGTYQPWNTLLWRIRTRLAKPLLAIYTNPKRDRATDAAFAANLLAEYASDQPRAWWA